MNRLLLIITLLTFSCVDVDINKEYSDGIANYKQGKFEIAIKNFSKVLTLQIAVTIAFIIEAIHIEIYQIMKKLKRILLNY